MTREEYEKELKRVAPFIYCPMCDEKKCCGRESCTEIKNFIERKLNG